MFEVYGRSKNSKLGKMTEIQEKRRILTNSQLRPILGLYNFKTVYSINLKIFGALEIVVENMWKEFEDR